MITIGITGIIGSGKTTASSMLKKRGFEIIDLDQLSKDLIRKEEVIAEIRRRLGEEYAAGGAIDVVRLRDEVFKNKESLRTLESIIHPKIRSVLSQRLGELERGGAEVVFVDGPLLFETGFHKEFDKVVVVSAKTRTIKQRLKARGMTKEDIGQRMPHQIPLTEKEKMADHVVNNNGNVESLEREVEGLLQRIKEWEVRANAP
ncbi:MAG TPA: dephospho-CoA kinase [Syntrophorhabdaceae bacterium]|nr:dephospho-CoA kinase [Syntrophorhabdaceae bacterium]HQM81558.1 dephospho-CoA kinase [Syntrophorhabdaceae bacterium]